MKDEIEDFKAETHKMLKDKPATRSDRNMVYFMVLKRKGLCHFVKNGIFIPWSHVSELPSPESIPRLHRKLKECDRSLEAVKVVKSMREENRVEMSAINDWFPVLDGSKEFQTCLFLDEGKVD